MSLFSKILEKLGFDIDNGSAPLTPPSPASAPPSPPASGAAPRKAISQVDVVARLEAMAAGHRERLNWKESIVDLLKLLGLDSSQRARKDLAIELGCPADKMADSARMNMWLHKIVLKKLAENGGNVPDELLV